MAILIGFSTEKIAFSICLKFKFLLHKYIRFNLDHKNFMEEKSIFPIPKTGIVSMKLKWWNKLHKSSFDKPEWQVPTQLDFDETIICNDISNFFVPFTHASHFFAFTCIFSRSLVLVFSLVISEFKFQMQLLI